MSARFIPSPGCTTGPYFPREFSDGNEDLTHRDGQTARGQHIWLGGRVLELGGNPTWNIVVEIWQADAAGIFRHPSDPCADQCDPGFWGWGRARTAKDGSYKFRTIIPGRYRTDDGGLRLPHINCAILGIGLNRRLMTSIFFENTPGGNTPGDAVLDCVPAGRRPLLIAKPDASLDADGIVGYRFDVLLRGDGETPFFLD